MDDDCISRIEWGLPTVLHKEQIMIEAAGFVLALVMFLIFLWDRYRQNLRIDIDQKNILIARLGMPGHRLDMQIGIAFYNLTVVNLSRSTTTLRDLHLEYKIGRTSKTAVSHVLQTGQVYAPLSKKLVDSAVVRAGSASVVLMNWRNFRSQIAEKAALGPGVPVSGSAFFPLCADDFEALKELREVTLVLTDYRGKRSTHAVDVEYELVERGANSVIQSRDFEIDANGNIIFG